MKRKYNSMMSGEELRSARKSVGLTLQQMADQLSTSSTGMPLKFHSGPSYST